MHFIQSFLREILRNRPDHGYPFCGDPFGPRGFLFFPRKSIREGASSLFGPGPERPQNISCLRATQTCTGATLGLLWSKRQFWDSPDRVPGNRDTKNKTRKSKKTRKGGSGFVALGIPLQKTIAIASVFRSQQKSKSILPSLSTVFRDAIASDHSDHDGNRNRNRNGTLKAEFEHICEICYIDQDFPEEPQGDPIKTFPSNPDTLLNPCP